jgi:cysteine synthase A
LAQEKLDHMRILGAQLQIVRSDSGRMTEKLTRDMIDAASVVANETGAF